MSVPISEITVNLVITLMPSMEVKSTHKSRGVLIIHRSPAPTASIGRAAMGTMGLAAAAERVEDRGIAARGDTIRGFSGFYSGFEDYDPALKIHCRL
jgi:hypothetical protein